MSFLIMKHAMDHWQQNRVNILFQTKRQWKKKSLGQKQQLVLQAQLSTCV